MIDVREITGMQHLMVAHWHAEAMNNPYHDFLGIACEQHQYNYCLWHEEDIARSPDLGDTRIADAKRSTWDSRGPHEKNNHSSANRTQRLFTSCCMLFADLKGMPAGATAVTTAVCGPSPRV